MAHLRRSCSERESCFSSTSAGCSARSPVRAVSESGEGCCGAGAAAGGGHGSDVASGCGPEKRWRLPEALLAGRGGDEAAAASLAACCRLALSSKCFTAGTCMHGKVERVLRVRLGVWWSW